MTPTMSMPMSHTKRRKNRHPRSLPKKSVHEAIQREALKPLLNSSQWTPPFKLKTDFLIHFLVFMIHCCTCISSRPLSFIVFFSYFIFIICYCICMSSPLLSLVVFFFSNTTNKMYLYLTHNFKNFLITFHPYHGAGDRRLSRRYDFYVSKKVKSGVLQPKND